MIYAITLYSVTPANAGAMTRTRHLIARIYAPRKIRRIDGVV
jgi:hypothetical protein